MFFGQYEITLWEWLNWTLGYSRLDTMLLVIFIFVLGLFVGMGLRREERK